jgi:hypothetical protein
MENIIYRKNFLFENINEEFENIIEKIKGEKLNKKFEQFLIYVYAIEFALSGLSTKNLKERGYGLFSIRRLVEYLNGKMIIKSGKASAIITRNKIQFKETLFKKGVEILIEVPIKGLDIYKILK